MIWAIVGLMLLYVVWQLRRPPRRRREMSRREYYVRRHIRLVNAGLPRRVRR